MLSKWGFILKIIQLLPTMAYGDAVGNDTLAIRDIIRSMGYQSDIYAEGIGPNLENQNICHFGDLSVKPADILIYHFSTGTQLNHIIDQFICRKIMIYHNITPSHYFIDYAENLYNYTKNGFDEAHILKEAFDYCLAVSEFNKQDLINYGYTCDIDVLPIIIPFSDYKKPPSSAVLQKYNDDYTNLLFVGRIVPNKKIENVIATFFHYQRNYNSKSRLFLVGSWDNLESYKTRLDDYVKALDLSNVIFSGHIKFDEILAYYKLADVFVCMSEHEGFCVPLVEAMFFDIPIVAAPHAAVPGTLGGSGVLLDEDSPLLAAGAVDMLTTDSKLREIVISNQRKRLSDFSYPVVRKQFETYLNNFLRGVS